MSNVASTAMQHTARSPKAGPPGANQRQFNRGTLDLLDEARGVVENAAQQGQELNPMIYQMLGMEPTYADHSAELQQAQSEYDSSQAQFNEAQKTFDTLKGIPQGKRSKQQRQQFRQLKKQLPMLQKQLGDLRDQHGKLATLPKEITGFNRMDPNDIPKESPFSGQNPLYQAQRTESERLNQYLQGGQPVDPTLVHQYDQAESQLRAKLQQRYGPDYENSSVGQIALQNFGRQKNEAYATWNQQMVERYNSLAFQGQANLQNLLQSQIGLMREPSTTAMNIGGQLSNLAGSRLAQQQTNLQERAAEHGLQENVTAFSPVPLMSAAGNLLNTPYQTTDPTTGQPVNTTVGGMAARGIASGAGALWNAIAGPSAGGAGIAAASPAAATAAGGVGAGMSAEGVGAGMSAAGGGEIVGDALAAL